MFVQTAQPEGIQRGDEVEAEGYPVVTAFRPSLSAVDVKKIGDGGKLAPVEFQAAAQRNSAEQCELVTLEAEFLELNRGREASTLICRAGGQVFDAMLSYPAVPRRGGEESRCPRPTQAEMLAMPASNPRSGARAVLRAGASSADVAARPSACVARAADRQELHPPCNFREVGS
jgi:hypothetical protein